MKKKYILWGALTAVLLFVGLGTITALIPNPWFMRMIPANSWDYIFLILNAVLLGLYVSLHLTKKSKKNTCSIAATTGGIGSALAFSCPICNIILVALFGSTALLTYFEPIRPALGVISVIILISAIYLKVKE